VTAREGLAQRCETIEQAYEFTLAYAAQGLSGDAGSQTGGQLRDLLSRAAAALDDLADQYRLLVKSEELEPRVRYNAFIEVLERDANAALAAVQLVLAQPSISSQLVDNLNASIHVRALLTDLFLIDEILKPRPS
jgi:hypothetical protein